MSTSVALFENFDRISSRLMYQDIVALCKTSPEYQSYCQDPKFWRRLGLRRFGYDLNRLRREGPSNLLNGIQDAYRFVEDLLDNNHLLLDESRVRISRIGALNDIDLVAAVLYRLAHLRTVSDAKAIILEEPQWEDPTIPMFDILCFRILPQLCEEYEHTGPNWHSVHGYDLHGLAVNQPFFFTHYYALFGPTWWLSEKVRLPLGLTDVLLEMAPVSNFDVINTLLARKMFYEFEFMVQNMSDVVSAGQVDDADDLTWLLGIAYRILAEDNEIDEIVSLYELDEEPSIHEVIIAIGPEVSLDILRALADVTSPSSIQESVDYLEWHGWNNDHPAYLLLKSLANEDDDGPDANFQDQ
jgi:hypothetical protein